MSRIEDVVRSQLTVLRVMEQAMYGQHDWSIIVASEGDSLTVEADVEIVGNMVSFSAKKVPACGEAVLYLACDDYPMLSRPTRIDQESNLVIDLAVPDPLPERQT